MGSTHKGEEATATRHVWSNRRQIVNAPQCHVSPAKYTTISTQRSGRRRCSCWQPGRRCWLHCDSSPRCRGSRRRSLTETAPQLDAEDTPAPSGSFWTLLTLDQYKTTGLLLATSLNLCDPRRGGEPSCVYSPLTYLLGERRGGEYREEVESLGESVSQPLDPLFSHELGTLSGPRGTERACDMVRFPYSFVLMRALLGDGLGPGMGANEEMDDPPPPPNDASVYAKTTHLQATKRAQYLREVVELPTRREPCAQMHTLAPVLSPPQCDCAGVCQALPHGGQLRHHRAHGAQPDERQDGE